MALDAELVMIVWAALPFYGGQYERSCTTVTGSSPTDSCSPPSYTPGLVSSTCSLSNTLAVVLPFRSAAPVRLSEYGVFSMRVDLNAPAAILNASWRIEFSDLSRVSLAAPCTMHT